MRWDELAQDILNALAAEAAEEASEGRADTDKDMVARTLAVGYDALREVLVSSSATTTSAAKDAPLEGETWPTAAPTTTAAATVQETIHRAHTALSTALLVAKSRVKHVPFQLVTPGTLRTYTDASLGLALLALVCLRRVLDSGGTSAKAETVETVGTAGTYQAGNEARARALEAVRMVDMAIIVAGAVGPRRMDWAQNLLAALQEWLASHGSGANDGQEPPRKRARVDSLPALSGIHASPTRRGTTDANTVTATDKHPNAETDTDAGAAAKPEPELIFAATPIPSIPPPSLASYARTHSTAPFILRGYLSNDAQHPRWRALEHWGSSRYLLQTVGRGRVVPVEIGRSYDEDGWGQRIVPFAAFLRRAGWAVGDTDAEKDTAVDDTEHDNDDGEDDDDDEGDGEGADGPQYLAQHALFSQFPQLERDTSVPEYVYSDPPPPDYMPYAPPEDTLVNVWVGPGGKQVVSPAHTDPFFNCYAQVLGRKRVWVAPPRCGADMYAYGDSKAADQDQDQDQDASGGDNNGSGSGNDANQGTDLGPEAQSTLASEYMTNTSTVPILRELDEAGLAAARCRFPRFYDRVFPLAMEAVLEPGDLLVMPPGWWHAMRGEGGGVCWSVSFWY